MPTQAAATETIDDSETTVGKKRQRSDSNEPIVGNDVQAKKSKTNDTATD